MEKLKKNSQFKEALSICKELLTHSNLPQVKMLKLFELECMGHLNDQTVELKFIEFLDFFNDSLIKPNVMDSTSVFNKYEEFKFLFPTALDALKNEISYSIEFDRLLNFRKFS